MSLCVTEWVARPRADAGLHLLDDETRDWRYVAYPELARRVVATAEELQANGLAGARIALLAADAEKFIVNFVATLAVGGACVPIVPQTPLQGAAEYEARTQRLLAVAQPDAVVKTADLSDRFPGYRTVVAPGDVSSASFADGPLDAGVEDAATALVQFSSGSSGLPKGIRISRRALHANITTISEWLRITQSDRAATWLPLYHDMGLIGTLLTPLVTQVDLFLMTPLQFLRWPHLWLRALGETCTMTAAPLFGFAYAARRVSKQKLAGCDFSDWRIAIIGAEPIRAEPLRAFTDLVSPFGFDERAFCPAYGLAESTLIVTGSAIEKPPTMLVGDRLVADFKPFGLDGSVVERGMVVGSGTCLPDASVSIRDTDGRDLPDSTVGEIWVAGPSLADGYEPPVPGTFEHGWFRTGDVGFMADGELFVYGRISDSFKVRGKLVLAEQAEQAIEQALPDLQRTVVVPSRHDGTGLTVLAETKAPADPAAVERAQSSIAGLFGGAEVDLVFVGRGGVPRTTSGKPKRIEAWRRYVLRDATGAQTPAQRDDVPVSGAST